MAGASIQLPLCVRIERPGTSLGASSVRKVVSVCAAMPNSSRPGGRSASCAGGRVRDRATIIQKKRLMIGFRASPCVTDNTSSRAEFGEQPHLSTRQYARMVHAWVSAGLDSSAYGTHAMRRTKAAQIYKKTGNLRAVQLLLEHTKLESTVRYLRIEVDDALSISERVEL